jgi:hypothetical protein
MIFDYIFLFRHNYLDNKKRSKYTRSLKGDPIKVFRKEKDINIGKAKAMKIGGKELNGIAKVLQDWYKLDPNSEIDRTINYIFNSIYNDLYINSTGGVHGLQGLDLRKYKNEYNEQRNMKVGEVRNYLDTFKKEVELAISTLGKGTKFDKMLQDYETLAREYDKMLALFSQDISEMTVEQLDKELGAIRTSKKHQVYINEDKVTEQNKGQYASDLIQRMAGLEWGLRVKGNLRYQAGIAGELISAIRSFEMQGGDIGQLKASIQAKIAQGEEITQNKVIEAMQKILPDQEIWVGTKRSAPLRSGAPREHGEAVLEDAIQEGRKLFLKELDKEAAASSNTDETGTSKSEINIFRQGSTYKTDVVSTFKANGQNYRASIKNYQISSVDGKNPRIDLVSGTNVFAILAYASHQTFAGHFFNIYSEHYKRGKDPNADFDRSILKDKKGQKLKEGEKVTANINADRGNSSLYVPTQSGRDAHVILKEARAAFMSTLLLQAISGREQDPSEILVINDSAGDKTYVYSIGQIILKIMENLKNKMDISDSILYFKEGKQVMQTMYNREPLFKNKPVDIANYWGISEKERLMSFGQRLNSVYQEAHAQKISMGMRFKNINNLPKSK